MMLLKRILLAVATPMWRFEDWLKDWLGYESKSDDSNVQEGK